MSAPHWSDDWVAVWLDSYVEAKDIRHTVMELKNKLFGRNDESSMIFDAYHRVALRGESEIAIVKGCSG